MYVCGSTCIPTAKAQKREGFYHGYGGPLHALEARCSQAGLKEGSEPCVALLSGWKALSSAARAVRVRDSNSAFHMGRAWTPSTCCEHSKEERRLASHVLTPCSFRDNSCLRAHPQPYQRAH